MRIGHAHAHRRLRDADAGDAVEMARVRRVCQIGAAEHCADHRRFALTVDLYEARAHEGQRALDVGHVHRRAAVDDGLEAARAVFG